MIIAVDFDGTCVTHEYPLMGREIPLCVTTLKELTGRGYKLILLTMRDGSFLQEAINWFAEREIPLYAVNENPSCGWSESRKVYANLYIDDAALGTPLREESGIRPYVDWQLVKDWLCLNHIL